MYQFLYCLVWCCRILIACCLSHITLQYFFLKKIYLYINHFFLKQIKDENGVTRWKKVKVNLEDHINIPSFPPKLELYDDYVDDYMSKIALNQLSQSKPLWEIHIIKYPTKNAQGMCSLPAILL